VTALVVDTNVLVAANGASQQANPRCVLSCVELLDRVKSGIILVLDDAWRLISEYQGQASSTGQPGVGDAS
jgi:hypothetical protein